jgi:CDP-diacylglycerol---glycerol-3-phosphate 3-phosphatidyltransferase
LASSPPPLNVKTVPNAITASRIVLAPLTLAAHQVATRAGNGFDDASELAVAWLFVCLVGLTLAEISDVMDGRVARKTGSVSNLGKLLDPLSDSLFRQCVFLGFTVAGWMPLWMMVVMFARDIVVAYLRVFAGLYDVVLAARVSGKVKAVVQATAQIALVCFAILHHYGVGEMLFDAPLPMDHIAFVLLLIATLVTAWSAWDYGQHVLGTIAKSAPPE